MTGLKSVKEVVFKHPQFGVLTFAFNFRALEAYTEKYGFEGLQDKNQLGVQANLCLFALTANRHKNPTLPVSMEKEDIFDIFDLMDVDTMQNLQKVMTRSMTEIAVKVGGKQVEADPETPAEESKKK